METSKPNNNNQLKNNNKLKKKQKRITLLIAQKLYPHLELSPTNNLENNSEHNRYRPSK